MNSSFLRFSKKMFAVTGLLILLAAPSSVTAQPRTDEDFRDEVRQQNTGGGGSGGSTQPPAPRGPQPICSQSPTAPTTGRCSCTCMQMRDPAGDNTPDVTATDEATCRTACTTACSSISTGQPTVTWVPPLGSTAPQSGAGSTQTTEQGGQTVRITQGVDVGATGINITNINLSQPIGGVRQLPAAQGIPRYIATVFRYAIGIVATIATIMVVYGGFRYLMGSTTGDISKGKEIIRDALVGLVLTLASYAILYTVNPDTVALRWPALTSINNVKLKTEDLLNRWSNTCVTDHNCPPGKVCLLSRMLNGPDAGQCTGGGRNERCRCRGTGCGIARDDAMARGSVNNCFTVNDENAELQCQQGLQCIQVGAFRCDYFNATGDASADYLCSDGLAFSPCDMRSEPGHRCGRVENTQLYCLQGGLSGCNLAGLCLYGDWRDDQFNNTPSDGIHDQWFPGRGGSEGGECVAGTVDVNVRQEQVKCNANAKCMQSDDGYAANFRSTVTYYNNISTSHRNRIPSNLAASAYMRYGCRKMVGETCTADAECPTKCINGRCSGFCYNRIRDDRSVPGNIRHYTQSDTDNIPGDFPDPIYIVSDCVSCTDGWSLMKDYLDAAWDAGTTVEQRTRIYINALSAMGGFVNDPNYNKSACLPKRPARAQCLFGFMCQSGNCNTAGLDVSNVSVINQALNEILRNPLDNTTGGPGQCD